jgi:tetratricopeptide (TPR) repeat protein
VRLLVVAAIVLPSVVHAAVEDDLRDGDKYFDAGDWKRAASAYDRAIAKAPGQVSPEAYGKRAAIFIIQKDIAGGIAFVARAKSRYPNAPEILEQEALLLWETDQQERAVAVAGRVVRARPAAFTNQKLLGEYYATRDPVKTAAAFEAYLAHRPDELAGGDVLPRIRLGFAYLASARAVLGGADQRRAEDLYGKAVEQFDYVRRKLGKKPNALVNAENGLCAAYTGLGQWDQAISTCERIAATPKRIDASGSVWFNLAKAYLARKQTAKARSAANQFARKRKGEARAFMLVGDTYFADRQWQPALDQYLRAEKALAPNQTREAVELSIQLGTTYRRLEQLDHAIGKLASAFQANPTSVELGIELGGAYLEAHQDAKTIALTDKLLGGPGARSADVLVLSGKALFNSNHLTEARQRFEAAHELRPSDVQIRRALVTTLNEQAFAAGDDTRTAQALLDQALAIDGTSPVTLTNVAVNALERGDCDAAQRQLVKLADIRGSDAVVTHRLLGRAYACASHRDIEQAIGEYVAAERAAKQANAQLALAEVYIEWAPLIWDTDLAEAIDKLETAMTLAASSRELAPAVKRNLALALYRRGWKQLRDGRATEAIADFERALREPSVLQASEPLALELSLALAQLDANRSAEAAKLFRALAHRGNAGAYLKGMYAKSGAQLFAAYAAKKCDDIASDARQLVAACWEGLAYDQWRAGQRKAAQKSLANAEKSASADQRHRLELDRTALSLSRDKLATLEAMNGNPPEALVNLGVIYDLLGRPREAYDAWTRAKARGVTSRDLQKWIDAKRRIHGY